MLVTPIPTEADLSFAPIQNPTPQRLTAAEIAQYNALGYVQPFDIFGAEEMRSIRRYLNGLMHDLGEQGAYGINCYQARLSGLYDIATDPRIVELVSDLVGPDVLCWATAILSKKPFDPKAVPGHQDASFWALSPARTVTVWLAIDNADEGNSAMRFIPGSHAHGKLKVEAPKGESVFHQQTAGAEELGAPFTNSLNAGQISLHADMLVHGSQPNTSGRRRCGFTLRYCAPSVQITDPGWAKGVEAILCQGDPGDWRVHPRPVNNDILATSSPHVVGNN
ncbi:MAG: phytanoyl-CoA dioxygenase family protein [Shimia sp.]